MATAPPASRNKSAVGITHVMWIHGPDVASLLGPRHSLLKEEMDSELEESRYSWGQEDNEVDLFSEMRCLWPALGGPFWLSQVAPSVLGSCVPFQAGVCTSAQSPRCHESSERISRTVVFICRHLPFPACLECAKNS